MNNNHFSILLANVPLGIRIKFEHMVKEYQKSLIRNSESLIVNKTSTIISNTDQLSQKVIVSSETQVFQLDTILQNYPQGSLVLDFYKKHNI